MLESYPTQFLRCRALGHAWEEFVPVGKRGPSFGFRYSLFCPSCEKERHDIYGHTGKVIDRSYVDPEGYALPFRLSRAEARLEYFSRTDRKIARRGSLLKVVD